MASAEFPDGAVLHASEHTASRVQTAGAQGQIATVEEVTQDVGAAWSAFITLLSSRDRGAIMAARRPASRPLPVLLG